MAAALLLDEMNSSFTFKINDVLGDRTVYLWLEGEEKPRAVFRLDDTGIFVHSLGQKDGLWTSFFDPAIFSAVEAVVKNSMTMEPTSLEAFDAFHKQFRYIPITKEQLIERQIGKVRTDFINASKEPAGQ